MKIDLTQEILEPNGSPIPWDGKPIATLGGVIYGVLTRLPANDYDEAGHFHDLAVELVGQNEFTFSTKDLARIQELVRGVSDTRVRVPAFRMLEIKGAQPEIPAEGDGAT